MEAKDTGTLVNHLDVIAKDKDFVESILKGKLSRSEQMARVRGLLTPAELERYNAGMKLIEELGKIEPKPPQSVDLRDIENMPDKSAEAVKLWLQYNAGTLRIYGSLIDWMYTKEFRPNDIDVAIARPKRATEELADIISKSSGLDIRIEKSKRFEDSYHIVRLRDKEWETIVDVHPMSMYKQQMPYNWRHESAIIIDKIPFEQLSEQFAKRGIQALNPGVGIEGRGMIGPKAAQRSWREKDIPRMEAVAGFLIKEADRQGKHKLAEISRSDLRILSRSPVKPYPQVIPPESKKETKRTKIRKVLSTLGVIR